MEENMNNQEVMEEETQKAETNKFDLVGLTTVVLAAYGAGTLVKKGFGAAKKVPAMVKGAINAVKKPKEDKKSEEEVVKEESKEEKK